MGDLNTKTFYLFARPSFLEGAARVFDFSKSLQVYNSEKSEKEADSKALANDWKVVGDDLKASINKYEQSKSNQ